MIVDDGGGAGKRAPLRRGVCFWSIVGRQVMS